LHLPAQFYGCSLVRPSTQAVRKTDAKFSFKHSIMKDKNRY